MRAPIGAETVILRSPSPTGAEAGGDRRMRLHPSSRAAKRLPSALRIITRMDARFSAFQAEEIKKSARELRQGGSNYRCCIPALAGFVSPQSVAPDGTETYRKACPEQQVALSEAERIDIVQWSFYDRTVKWLALLILAASQCACTTLANRRDLYSPEPAPDSQEAIRQITAKPQTQQTPAPKPQFR